MTRVTWLCPLILFLGCSEPEPDNTCTSDEECASSYACDPLAEEGSLNEIGCVDRCATDNQCVAGTICLPDGTCG